MKARRVLLAGLAGAALALAPGCRAGSPPAAPGAAAAPTSPGASASVNEAAWQDAFVAPPEVLVVLYPGALRDDPVYGPLLRRAIALARQQSRVVARTRALEVIEDAEEVIAGWRSGGEDGDDLVLVIRGVRADVDPATVVDSDGRPLWAPGPPGDVRELVRASDASSADSAPASLFELPGRTWVIATGDARARVRSAFLRGPRVRRPVVPEPRAEEALLSVRIDGPSLVRHVPALRPGGERPRALGAVGRDLVDVVLEVAAGGTGGTEGAPPVDGGAPASPTRLIEAVLSYGTADAASAAEATVAEVLEALARRKSDLAWLPAEPVSVTRPPPGARVVLTAPLPPRLMDALTHVGARAEEAASTLQDGGAGGGAPATH
ncbi:MAG TPA: hypothetical protein VHV30_14090 [Polyangiaceae bacterium]|nr:hypothetical protein [Polyangiaceae bacterium]